MFVIVATKYNHNPSLTLTIIMIVYACRIRNVYSGISNQWNSGGQMLKSSRISNCRNEEQVNEEAEKFFENASKFMCADCSAYIPKMILISPLS